MRKLTVIMPDVSECVMVECAYNTDRACHARAITVGDGAHAACDTFFASEDHAADRVRVAGVGACKVTTCRHNTDFECTSASIRVGRHEQHADCLTFSAR